VCVCHCQRHDDKRSDYANAAAESPPPDRAVVAYLAGRKLTATAKRRQDKTVGRFASELDRVSLLGRLLSPCKLLPLSAKSHLRTYNQMYRTHLSVLKTSHNGVDNSLSQSVSLSLSLSVGVSVSLHKNNRRTCEQISTKFSRSTDSVARAKSLNFEHPSTAMNSGKELILQLML